MSSCLVYRKDESIQTGAQFDGLRQAMEYIKSRASTENKTVSDYTIVPMIQE